MTLHRRGRTHDRPLDAESKLWATVVKNRKITTN